ncbi:DUF6887 family protein [Floridanema aerugineum]|uniref:Uncharacterized protein n=1 Tax=Floridaenema aerugineum BLCC-F46 TaxID=3153654 RepID=A0ABV4X991_9CYAN
MNQPNFQNMSKKELLSYYVKHRNEDEAFYALMDKIYAEPPGEIHPAPQSIDDLKNFPELLERKRQQEQENELQQ